MNERSAGYGIIPSLKIPSFKLGFHLWQCDFRSDNINLLTIVVIWIAMAALVNPVGDFPLIDDWVYAFAVKSVLETGHFQFLPFSSSANVGPQVYWGALFCLPFGFSFTALRVSTLTLGCLVSLRYTF